MKPSKAPMYIIIILMGLILATAWGGMMMGFMPDMAMENSIRVVYSHSKEEDAGVPYRFNLTATSMNDSITVNDVKAYFLKKSDFMKKYPALSAVDFDSQTLSQVWEGNFYTGSFSPLEKNDKYYFFLKITDSTGKSFTLPKDAVEKGTYYHVSYKQNPNKWGLLIHILLMMVALMFLIHAFYYALNYIWNKTDWNIGKGVWSMFWGTLCFAISAFPLGIWIEYEKYGTYWTGFPLGTDITDNKSLFNFLYWFIILILMKGTILKKDHDKNLIGKKTFAWLTLLGAIITMVVRFAIPHGDL